MSEATFLPGRLRLARELKTWTQADLAEAVNLTAAAISQFESGAARPSASTQVRLGEELGVQPAFFELPIIETHEGFFRSLRRTPTADRRRARAIAHIAHDLATTTAATVSLPALALPSFPISSLNAGPDEIEDIAGRVRKAWNIPAGPAPDVVGTLESHGVIVMRLPLDSADVDAFSLPFADRPVVVLGSDKNDRARSRFDAAHELGHLVMHGEQVWGVPEVEKQAHEFAAAFLMPREDIENELPDRASWVQLFELKLRWQVSLAALLMRAKTLGRMSETNYLTAVKAASARGWRRVEPVPLGEPEQPELFSDVLHSEKNGASTLLPDDVIQGLMSAIP